MSGPARVGALIHDDRNRIYVHHRTADRRLLPDTWEIVGGHVEPGEAADEALPREVEQGTGWTLRRVEAVIADWAWELDGSIGREIDYLVEVDGDLGAPRLDEGKHDAYAWVGRDDLELMMAGRTDRDRRLRDVVAKAVRTRVTDRLRLEPIGAEHADDLLRLHSDPRVAAWHGHAWTAGEAVRKAVDLGRAWEAEGVQKWAAYERDTNRLVGRGGLSFADVAGRRGLEVGWTLYPDLWGRGYATEIGRAGLAFAFRDLAAEEVVAFTERHNVRSRAVMERLGMRYVEEFLGTGLVEGREGVHGGAPFVLYELDRATWQDTSQ